MRSDELRHAGDSCGESCCSTSSCCMASSRLGPAPAAESLPGPSGARGKAVAPEVLMKGSERRSLGTWHTT